MRIELAPGERLLIGDTCIRNGDRRSRFLIETDAKVIKGKNLILASEADTPCKRLYLVVEYMYLADEPSDHEAGFVALANEIMAAVPTMRPHVAAIFERIEARRWYEALRSGRDLIAYEAQLRDIAAGRPRPEGPDEVLPEADAA